MKKSKNYVEKKKRITLFTKQSKSLHDNDATTRLLIYCVGRFKIKLV